MQQDLLVLFMALVLIVFSAELFTNGIEWLGQRLGLSEGIVGSILAAVGTALPETLIPIIAVFFARDKYGPDVGIGAIAGAPFMLSTLTLSLCGLSMFFFARTGRRAEKLSINTRLLSRDLRFFIVAYSIAILASLASGITVLRWVLALALILIYPYYVYRTYKNESELGSEPEPLHLERFFKSGSKSIPIISLQVVLGLAGILCGAGFFVDKIEKIAKIIGFAPIFLSLIVSPIATELPEKINSVLWARKGKDTLALANITGALVFQACFPVAFGVAFTSWKLDFKTIGTGLVAITSALIYLNLIAKNRLRPIHLMCGAIAYAIVITFIIVSDTFDPVPVAFR